MPGENRSSYIGNSNTKELGLTRELMNSIALFIYNRNYDSVPNAVEIFNEWATACNIKFDRADEVCAILEHIRKMSQVNRIDLRLAIKMDYLLPEEEGLDYEGSHKF